VTQEDIYQRLAKHLSELPIGYPYRDSLVEMLKENFSKQEAEVALAIPSDVTPLKPLAVGEIARNTSLTKEQVRETLEGLTKRGLVYVGKTADGDTGYALHQVGFGFPQTFFWKGEETPHVRRMAELTAKYFSREVTRESFSPTKTKAYRYIPVEKSLKPAKQGVYPQQLMTQVIEQAEVIALGHCPCRMAYSLRGGKCDHPKEVCLKFNRMARYVIERGLAREITKQEAHEIIRKAEEEGLVHFVDNTEGDIQHNCNCCGCACWNVGNIRRGKIPRDVIMATYFLRETDLDQCIGCGECVEICPVAAVKLEDDRPVVDEEWCIGCGVCARVCPTDSISMKVRPDREGQLPASNFDELHERIKAEKKTATLSPEGGREPIDGQGPAPGQEAVDRSLHSAGKG